MFASRLRKLRVAAKLTQSELSEKLGVGRTTIASYEQGNREPDLYTLNKIADFFNVNVDYLLGRSSNEHSVAHDEDALGFMKDPEINLFFKELLDAPEERIEDLRKVWEIIKRASESEENK
ncbi:HTH-type transcriptional regulator Xre [compost metagenome]